MEPSTPLTTFSIEQVSKAFPSFEQEKEVESSGTALRGLKKNMRVESICLAFTIITSLGSLLLVLSSHKVILDGLDAVPRPWDYVLSYSLLGIFVLSAINVAKKLKTSTQQLLQELKRRNLQSDREQNGKFNMANE